MGGKQMEGDNRERRKMAKEARDHGKKPSEISATLGASKQRQEAAPGDSHQERLDLKTAGKVPSVRKNDPLANPGNRDDDEHRKRYPRL